MSGRLRENHAIEYEPVGHGLAPLPFPPDVVAGLFKQVVQFVIGNTAGRDIGAKRGQDFGPTRPGVNAAFDEFLGDGRDVPTTTDGPFAQDSFGLRW
jgi:hypothetical protein